MKSWQIERNKISEAEKEAPVAKRRMLPTPGQPVNSKDLLEALFYSFSNVEYQNQNVEHWINNLINKFEVTKHLHPSYDGSFKAHDKSDYQSLDLYVRFAEVLEIAYRTDNLLSILNCLLKCMDVLCGIKPKLTEDQCGRLARLVVKERDYINELLHKTVECNLPL